MMMTISSSKSSLVVSAGVLLVLSAVVNARLDPTLYQPEVILVDSKPGASEGYCSLSMAEGSPFCNGRPMFWIAGHQFDAIEQPWCQSTDGTWAQDSNIEMDVQDAKSVLSGWKSIDRHGCTFVDANLDGHQDIACVGGANWHRDFGYQELYLTGTDANGDPDGTFSKEIDNGLQKYTSMSHRWIRTLGGVSPNDPNKTNQIVFLTTSGSEREDLLPNQHRMFRVLDEGEPPEARGEPNSTEYIPAEMLPYFAEVYGPWIGYFFVSAPPLVGDFNGDGLDDFMLYGWAEPSHMYIQQSNGNWTEVPMPLNSRTEDLQSARIANVTDTPYNDMLISTGGFSGIQRWYFHIIPGMAEAPYFDFKFPIYSYRLGTQGLDLEVLDVNGDGMKDIYVNQMNQQDCGKSKGVPTIDRARDLLFVGILKDGKKTWEPVRMDSQLRGCGGFMEKFGNETTMVLANGNHEHTGYHYILKW